MRDPVEHRYEIAPVKGKIGHLSPPEVELTYKVSTLGAMYGWTMYEVAPDNLVGELLTLATLRVPFRGPDNVVNLRSRTPG